MKHVKSLSKLAAVSVLGLAACGGGSKQSQPNTPSSAQNTQSTSEQSGSAMGQPGSPTESPNAATTAPSATGGADAYGSQGTVGSGTSPGSASGSYGTGSYGASSGAGQGTSGQTNPGSAGSTGNQSGAGQYGQGTSGSPSGGSDQSGAPSTGATSTMGGSMDVSNLNDAQIAAVMTAINQGEIQEAQLAQTKASSPDVKKFAQHMVSDHRDLQKKDDALLSRLQITPADNTVSNQLKSDSQNSLSMLQGLSGQEFDREYMDAQVKDHNQALTFIDRAMPNVQSGQFKSQLQTARGKVEQHLRQAERIQQTLQQGNTNKQRGSSGSQQH